MERIIGRKRSFKALAGMLAIAGCVGLGGDLVAADGRLAERLSPDARNLVAPGAKPSTYKPRTVVSPLALPQRASRGRVDYALMEARLQRLMARPDMVGLGVAVIEDGEIRFLKGYGQTATTGGGPVGTRTVFRWASLSKGVASTIVAELADEGRLSLSDPVSKWSPSLRLPGGAEHSVTVADLLAHRLGISRNAFDGKLEGGASPQALRAQLVGLPQLCAPSTCHSYQNVAFDAAAEIVETVTGRRYSEVVHERLFGPLGMRSASMTRTALVGSADWARPHVGRAVVPVTEPYYRVPAAGGVNSSIFDLAQWLTAQMGDAPDVIPQRVLTEIHAPRVATARRSSDFTRAMSDQNYALGWRKYSYAGRTLVGHQGAVRGYRSAILFDPGRKAGIAILWNSGSGRPIGLQLEVLEMLYGLERRDWMKLDQPAPRA